VTLGEKLRSGWNAFKNADSVDPFRYTGVATEPTNPQRSRVGGGNERSIILSVLTRMSIDVASFAYKHIKTDEKGRYLSIINDSLHQAMTVSANLDQAGTALFQDIAMSMFDEGVIAVVPTLTDSDPTYGSEAWNVVEMRVGKIVGWRPEEVDINIYNPLTGKRVTLPFPKRSVAIIQNPWFNVMNEPNSTLRRLIRKLNLLDRLDEEIGSNKLDILLQLPHEVRSDMKRKEAERRRDEIISQLRNSEYGIAYVGATERITQLNRPAENNLLTQIESLTKLFFSQLGMTEEILNGTADESTMKNYMARMIGPVATAIVEEFSRKFLSKTSRTQGGTIRFFSNPFAFTTASGLADIGDKLTRNAIVTSNEVRSELGYEPSSDPDADVLRNKNLNPPKETETIEEKITVEEEANPNADGTSQT